MDRRGSWRSSRLPASKYFDELVELGGSTQADPQAPAVLSGRYELEVDPESIPGLVERFDLRFPGEPI